MYGCLPLQPTHHPHCSLPCRPRPARRSFTSKVCKKTKTFGEPVEKVLFVFDGQKAPDMNALVAQVRRWAGRCWRGGC